MVADEVQKEYGVHGSFETVTQSSTVRSKQGETRLLHGSRACPHRGRIVALPSVVPRRRGQEPWSRPSPAVLGRGKLHSCHFLHHLSSLQINVQKSESLDEQ